MRTRWAVAGAVLALVLSVSPTLAIIGGQPDNNRHPASGVILMDTWGWCSGTLVASKVVMTAGHCPARFDEFYAADPWDAWVSFDEDPGVVWEDYEFEGVVYNVPFHSGSGWYKVASWHSHPAYSDADWPDTAEIGVVLLQKAASVAPVSLAPAATLEGLFATASTASKSTFTPVGYGVDGYVRGGGLPSQSTEVDRRMATETGAYGSLTERLYTTKAAPSKKSGGTCSGDSGGGVYLGSTQRVVGVHIGGWQRGIIPICGTYASIQYRVDTAEARDFLADYGVPLP